MYIRYIMLVFSLFVGLATNMYAQTKVEDTSSVQALVAKVKKAPPSQRRVLMNALKIKLRSMQKKTRREVMLGLRHTFNTQHQSGQIKNMQSSMQQQSASMMSASQEMTDAMNTTSMTNMGYGGGMNPSQFKGTGK